MKTGLKKREKVLLFAAFVVGLVTLTSTYVISPMSDQLAEKRERRENLTFERMQLDIKIASEEVYRQTNTGAYEAYTEIASRYPQFMPNNEIDKILTGLTMRQSFMPISLSLSDTARNTWGPAFSTVTASMTLHGGYESLISLINAVEKIDYIRITNVRYSVRDEGHAIGVAFEVTMMNPIEPEGSHAPA
jgi:Tfp pilus assembly protein PilO